MTLRQLAEITALVALHGNRLVSAGGSVSDQSLGPYLKHAQERSQKWRALFDQIVDQTDTKQGAATDSLVALLSEVLVSEMLARVWTAVLAAHDCHERRIHAEPIARHVLMGVLQVRTKVLKELLGGRSYPVGTLLQVDIIRRKCDRWTDLLIGELSLDSDVTRFAVDPARAREFRDHSRCERPSERQVTWSLLQAGLARAVPDVEVAEETLAAHRGVVESILSTLPDSPLDDEGRLHMPTVWRVRPRRDAVDLIPPAVAERLRSLPPVKNTPPGPTGLLAELLRRLADTNRDPPPAVDG